MLLVVSVAVHTIDDIRGSEALATKERLAYLLHCAVLLCSDTSALAKLVIKPGTVSTFSCTTSSTRTLTQYTINSPHKSSVGALSAPRLVDAYCIRAGIDDIIVSSPHARYFNAYNVSSVRY